MSIGFVAPAEVEVSLEMASEAGGVGDVEPVAAYADVFVEGVFVVVLREL